MFLKEIVRRSTKDTRHPFLRQPIHHRHGVDPDIKHLRFGFNETVAFQCRFLNPFFADRRGAGMSFGEQDITMNCLQLSDTSSCQCLLNGARPRTINIAKHLRFHTIFLNSGNNLIGTFRVECHRFVKIDMFSSLRTFCPNTPTAFYICTETHNMHILTRQRLIKVGNEG